MNYYDEIKNKIIENEIYSKVKEYSKEKHKITTYYEIGRLINEAGGKYGENIIGEYSNKLMAEVGKKYNKRTLFRMKQFYNLFSNEKVSTLSTQLSWSHYTELLPIKEESKLLFYLNLSIEQKLDVRSLRLKIKNEEYERLDESTKSKLINDKKLSVTDFIKNPILIKSEYNRVEISEKILKRLILEDIDNFLLELGKNFSYIRNEYKIKIGDKYNYIDLLLYNIEFNCYVVVELKVTELKKEHIGQVQVYMNYIDNHLKKIDQDKSIGIIICKKDNKYIIEYCSDDRIISREYELF